MSDFNTESRKRLDALLAGQAHKIGATWTKIIPEQYEYWESCISFTCDCGKTVAVDDETVQCTCGRIYRLISRLEVIE